MSKQLYEEALADVKSLKAVAEDNAKRALIEAVTPRIRDLIEKQLLRENMGPEEEEDEFDFDFNSSLPDPNPAPGSVPAGPKGSKLMTDNQIPGKSTDVAVVTLDLQKLADDEGDHVHSEFDLDSDSLGLLGTLNPKYDEPFGSVGEFEDEMKSVGNKVMTLSKFQTESVNNSLIENLISQLDDMYAYVQENVSSPAKKNLYESKLETYFKILNKLQEQKNMRNVRGRRTLREADVKMTLKGLPDDLNLEDLEIDLESGDEEVEGEEEDMEGGDEEEDMDLEGGDDEGEEEDDMDLDLEGGDEEGGDEEEEDLELSGYNPRMESRHRRARGHGRGRLFFESDDKDEDDAEEMDDEDAPKKGVAAGVAAESRRRLGDNVIVEIDEGMLRREIGRMKVLRETRERNARRLTEMKRRTRRIAEKAVKVPSTKGNGPGKLRDHDDLGDPILDIDLNELSEALRRERRGSSRNDVRPNDTSRRVHTENDNKLRAKLAEANLFNAKLAYSNKLLQNESLTKRQKAQVIERLDEAKNLREVKLVYESLVKTMAGTSRPLRENAERRVLGSSSRPTRSASTTLNEGVETERWARLAGILK